MSFATSSLGHSPSLTLLEITLAIHSTGGVCVAPLPARELPRSLWRRGGGQPGSHGDGLHHGVRHNTSRCRRWDAPLQTPEIRERRLDAECPQYAERRPAALTPVSRHGHPVHRSDCVSCVLDERRQNFTCMLRVFETLLPLVVAVNRTPLPPPQLTAGWFSLTGKCSYLNLYFPRRENVHSNIQVSQTRCNANAARLRRWDSALVQRHRFAQEHLVRNLSLPLTSHLRNCTATLSRHLKPRKETIYGLIFSRKRNSPSVLRLYSFFFQFFCFVLFSFLLFVVVAFICNV